MRVWQSESAMVSAESTAMPIYPASLVLRKTSSFRSVDTKASIVRGSWPASSGADHTHAAESISLGISMAKLMSPATEAAAANASMNTYLGNIACMELYVKILAAVRIQNIVQGWGCGGGTQAQGAKTFSS